ncbi:MAG TPA: c-type cytochrome [Pelobium sp.]
MNFNQLKPLLFTSAIICVISLAAMVPSQQKDDHQAKNLKVLPKDISHEELKKVMSDFKTALGVKCDFCHAKSKADATKLDFASDEKEEKLIARDMMRMTYKINKKYFKHHEGDDNVAAIQCVTCHRGNKEPELALK